jgi:hypothetical protein
MDDLKIPATDRSPEVDFVFGEHRLSLRGESYPENVPAFYGPILEALDNYLDSSPNGNCTFNFELIYFNSSSAKAIMAILEKLDQAAGNGAKVTVNWRYDEEDDTMRELGEEFGADLEHATFHLKRLSERA